MREGTKRQQQATATRKKLFDHAMQLFTTHSYEAVTVQDICKGANVSVGAFYHHFKNKESVLNEGYRLFDLKAAAELETAHPEAPAQALRTLILCQLGAVEEMGHAVAAHFYKNQLVSVEKYALNTDRFFYKSMLATVQEAIESNALQGEAETITQDILSTCRGMIYDWCLHEGSYSLTEKGLHLLDVLLHYYEGRS